MCSGILAYKLQCSRIYKWGSSHSGAAWWSSYITANQWQLLQLFQLSGNKLVLALKCPTPAPAPAIVWPAARTGRWRWRWRGSPWPRWWPAGLRSSPDPRGLLSSGAGSGWRTQSRRSHSDHRLDPGGNRPQAPLSSAASGRCGWTLTGRPPRAHPALQSADLRSGIGHPAAQWRSLQESGQVNTVSVAVVIET